MPTLRIEFVRITSASPNVEAIDRVLAEAELPITASATLVGAQPAAPDGATHAVLTAVGGACYADWANINPGKSLANPATAGRVYIPSGESRVVIPGKNKIACIQANLS